MSARRLVHIRITPTTVLQVLLFVISDKVNYDDKVQATILQLLYDAILKHLTVLGGKLVTRKRQDLESAQTITQNGEFSLTYHFRWHDKPQAVLLRESVYRSMTIYPYQLVVNVDEPHKADSLHTYFATTC